MALIYVSNYRWYYLSIFLEFYTKKASFSARSTSIADNLKILEFPQNLPRYYSFAKIRKTVKQISTRVTYMLPKICIIMR